MKTVNLRRKRITFAIVTVAALILLIVMASAINRIKAVPLIDGIYYGMSPKAVSRILGEYTVTDDGSSFGHVLHEYSANVLGCPAEITCQYYNNYLHTIYIKWEDDRPFDAAYECIYKYYCDDENFFCKENTRSLHDEIFEKGISLGTDDGAIGVRYDIDQYDTHTTVHCQELR